MATVFLWLDNQAPAFLGGVSPLLRKMYEGLYPNYKQAVIGHASIHISDNYKPLVQRMSDGSAAWVDDSEDYVSFFPGGGESHRGYKRGKFTKSVFRDLAYEKYAPDTIVRIETGPKQEARMRKAWDKFKKKKAKSSIAKKKKKPEHDITKFGPSYRFYRKNCSDAVARVMNAAKWGGNPLINFFDKKITILRPRLILTKIKVDFAFWKKKHMTWEEFINEVYNSNTDNRLLSEDTKNSLIRFRCRQNNDGTSGVRPRFVYEKGKLKEDTGHNTWQYIWDECKVIENLEFPKLKARDLKLNLKAPDQEFEDLVPVGVEDDHVEGEDVDGEEEDDEIMDPPDMNDDPPPPPPQENQEQPPPPPPLNDGEETGEETTQTVEEQDPVDSGSDEGEDTDQGDKEPSDSSTREDDNETKPKDPPEVPPKDNRPPAPKQPENREPAPEEIPLKQYKCDNCGKKYPTKVSFCTCPMKGPIVKA